VLDVEEDCRGLKEWEHLAQGDVTAVIAGRAAAGSGRPTVVWHCSLSHDCLASMLERMSVEQGNVWHELGGATMREGRLSGAGKERKEVRGEAGKRNAGEKCLEGPTYYSRGKTA
jgi:hypothetical protein